MNRSKAKYAEQLRAAIQSGRFQAGQKLPSLRRMANEWGCSLSLAAEAYGLLVREGLLIPRDRSGYWVSDAHPTDANLPVWGPTEDPDCANQLYDEIRQQIYQPGSVSFAGNTPHPSWLPLTALRKITQDVTEAPEPYETSVDAGGGYHKLRLGIAQLAAQEGWRLDPNELTITGGSSGLSVYLCLKAVTRPGDRVLVESPFAPDLREMFWSLGLTPIEVPIHETKGLGAASFAQALKRFSPAASLLQPCFHYPSGALTPVEDRRRIAEISGELDHPVVELTSLPFLPLDEPALPLKAYETEARNILWCSGSGALLGPGMSVGWCAPGRYRDLVVRHKLASVRTAPALQQRVLSRFMASESFKRHLRQLKRTATYAAEQHRDEIEASFPPGTVVNRPAGGYAIWIKLPNGLTAKALQQAAADERIIVIPGEYFEATGSRLRQYIVIHPSAPCDDDRRAALRRLGRIARRLLTEAQANGPTAV